MGQSTSQQIHEFFEPIVAEILAEENCGSLLSAEIRNLTYDDFLRHIGDLNTL